MSLLDAALEIAGWGWPIMPLSYERGTPLLGRDRDGQGEPIPNTGGVRKASADLTLVRQWWTRWPNARIAAAAGAPIGAFVLDVDVKEADGLETLALLEDRHRVLPETWKAWSPSGGLHLYFRQPAAELVNKVGFAPGLDIRATGASITLPPSRKPTGAYRWAVTPDLAPLADAPAWLVRMAVRPPPEPVGPFKAINLRHGDRYAAAALDDECRQVAGMGPNSGRNQALFRASARMGELVAGGLARADEVEAALVAAACACGLHLDDGGMAGVRGTIANGFRHGAQKPRQPRRSDVSPALRSIQRGKR